MNGSRNSDLKKTHVDTERYTLHKQICAVGQKLFM